MHIRNYVRRCFIRAARLKNAASRLDRDWTAIGTISRLRNCPPAAAAMSHVVVAILPCHLLLCFPFSFLCFLEEVVRRKVPRLELLGPRLERDWPAIASISGEVIWDINLEIRNRLHRFH